MKIFYYCSVGINLSLVAANLHLEVVDSANLNCREIINLPYFHCLKRDEIGTPIKIGTDSLGNDIYTFGVKNENILLSTAMQDWLEILGINKGEYHLVDLTGLEKPVFRLANFLSIILGFKKLGKYIAAQGIKMQINQIKNIVNDVKKTSAI